MRAALQQALTALEQITFNVYDEDCLTHKVAAPAITAIKQALAEPESEPNSCRTELVTAIYCLASHYENKICLFQDDEEAHRAAKGDIAHAKKVAARWNWNGAEPSKRDTGKAYNDGRRAMLDEVLRIAPGSVAVLLERLKEDA